MSGITIVELPILFIHEVSISNKYSFIININFIFKKVCLLNFHLHPNYYELYTECTLLSGHTWLPTYNYAITNIITFIYSFLSGVVLLHNVSFIWCCHHWHYFQHITCVMKYQTSMFVCMYVWIYSYVYMFSCLAIFMRVCTYICIYMFEYMWSYWHININIKLCYILRICYNHANWNVLYSWRWISVVLMLSNVADGGLAS